MMIFCLGVMMSKIFNSPVETGLRVLAILEAGYPNAYDMTRIAVYDYLLVHSGDVDGGPESIHPDTPNRSGELLVRRPMLEEGIRAMISRGLVSVACDKDGILYSATELSSPFLDSLRAAYTRKMLKTSAWVVSEFDSYTSEELRGFVEENIGGWGSEFSGLSIFSEKDDF